jgi:hypothetical protein
MRPPPPDAEVFVLAGTMDLWDGEGPSPALGPDTIRALFSTPLPRLRTLRLPLQGLDAVAARALAGCELPALVHLDVRGNVLGADGVRALIDGFPDLVVLDVRHNGLDPEERRALSDAFDGMLIADAPSRWT